MEAFQKLLDACEGIGYLDTQMKHMAMMMLDSIRKETKNWNLGQARLLNAFVLYYTVKRYRAPYPEEVRAILKRVGVSIKLPSLLRAIKRYRTQFGAILNLDWIFECEGGKSNLEVYVFALGGSYKDIARGRELAKARGLNVAVEADTRKVVQLLNL